MKQKTNSLICGLALLAGTSLATAQIPLSPDAPTISQDFDAMGTTLNLPDGWKIDRNLTAPRTVGEFSSASSSVMYEGGVSLASNAKNGPWNFGASANTADRAVGGLTTTVANGTRCLNVMTSVKNAATVNIERLAISYDIEKYRNGSNPAGFAVQLYSSSDGVNWTSAGSDFYTKFDPDTATEGYAEVPGETFHVSATLPATIQRGCDLYLAWNISTASGDACNAAMALAIDNFSISGSLPEIPVAEHYIYAIDKTGWASLGLYAYGDSEFYGAWPGQTVIDEREINGRTYKVFPLDTNTGNYKLIFNNWNNGKQSPEYPIVANRDYYFEVTGTTVREIDPFTAIDDVATDPDAFPVEYYNLQGIKVADPQPGTLYITRRGPRTSKILFR